MVYSGLQPTEKSPLASFLIILSVAPAKSFDSLWTAAPTTKTAAAAFIFITPLPLFITQHSDSYVKKQFIETLYNRYFSLTKC